MGRGEGEGLERSGQASPDLVKGGGGRGGGLWRLGGDGSGAKKQAGLGTPKDLSLKKLVSPPLTLTLFLGPSFLPFPFREGGSWSLARQHPQDPAVTAKMKDKSRLLGGTRGCCVLAAVPQWASVSPACQGGGLTPSWCSGVDQGARGGEGGEATAESLERAVGEG